MNRIMIFVITLTSLLVTLPGCASQPDQTESPSSQPATATVPASTSSSESTGSVRELVEITSVSPDNVNPDGGTIVRIIGNNFEVGTAVHFI